MPAKPTAQEAVSALTERFGPRLQAGLGEGRKLMAEVLAEELEISAREAGDLVHSLEEARSIRWVEQGDPVPGPPPDVAQGSGPGRLEPLLGGSGHWQLSPGEG